MKVLLVDENPKEFIIEPPNIEVCLRHMAQNTSLNPTLLSSFGVNSLEPALGHCHNTYARTIKTLWSIYGAINTGLKVKILDRMVTDNISRSDIELLIDMISSPILEILDHLKSNPTITWSKEAYIIIGRDDMYKQLKLKPTVCDPNTEMFKLPFLKVTRNYMGPEK